jgi:hypothetical protein
MARQMNKNLSPHMILLLAQKSAQGKTLLKQIDMIWAKIEKLVIKEMK